MAYTNSDLCNALMLEGVHLEEAKELAKTILNKKFVGESLAALLSAIYGSQVLPEELAQIDRSSITRVPLKSAEADKIVTKSKELREHSKQLNAHYQELGVRFIGFKARFREFEARFAEFKDEYITRKKLK